jgi:hypothetical protein
MIITYKELRDKGACVDQLALFKSRFGAAVTVTVEGALGLAKGFDLNWLDKHFLTGAISAEYKTKHASIWAEYEAKRASIWAEYNTKRASISAEYEAKRASILAEYNTKRASIWAEYEAKRAPILAEYLIKEHGK